jgi:alpha-beta hydrolase superfamily lysophospholipase
VVSVVIKTKDGVELFVRDWPVPTGTRRRGSALIIHGLGEHSGRYVHVAAALNDIGVAVRGYDHRGFGQSGGPRATIPSPNELLDDAKLVFDAFAAEAKAAGDPAPPFLIGHSMGGAIAARAVTGGWIRPRGLVLSSPALKTGMPLHLRLLVAVGNRLTPNLVQPHGLPLHKISHDPQVLAAAKNDPLCHDKATPRLVAFILDAGRCALSDAGKLDVPALLLVAGEDRLVDPQGAREFAVALPPGCGTLHWYAPLWHEVFNEREPDRSRVLGDLKAWIGDQLEAKRR